MGIITRLVQRIQRWLPSLTFGSKITDLRFDWVQLRKVVINIDDKKLQQGIRAELNDIGDQIRTLEEEHLGRLSRRGEIYKTVRDRLNGVAQKLADAHVSTGTPIKSRYERQIFKYWRDWGTRRITALGMSEEEGKAILLKLDDAEAKLKTFETNPGRLERRGDKEELDKLLHETDEMIRGKGYPPEIEKRAPKGPPEGKTFKEQMREITKGFEASDIIKKRAAELKAAREKPAKEDEMAAVQAAIKRFGKSAEYMGKGKFTDPKTGEEKRAHIFAGRAKGQEEKTFYLDLKDGHLYEVPMEKEAGEKGMGITASISEKETMSSMAADIQKMRGEAKRAAQEAGSSKDLTKLRYAIDTLKGQWKVAQKVGGPARQLADDMSGVAEIAGRLAGESTDAVFVRKAREAQARANSLAKQMREKAKT